MSETAATEEVSAAGENRDCAKKEEKDSIRLMRAGLSDAKELHEMQKVCFWPIFILTEYQGFGYAQEAIRQAEAEYPESILWELETILQEPKLRHLYEKMGYRRTGKTERIRDGMDLVYYEKEV